MSDNLTPIERVGNTLAAIRENELEQLLADVHRIADGLGSFHELAVRLTPRPETAPPIVDGYDAKFWNQSYNLLRDAVTTHLADCIQDDDVAEEHILVEAIRTAGNRLRPLADESISSGGRHDE